MKTMRTIHLFLLLFAAPALTARADDGWARFAELPVWDDGLSEMCYYDATDTIYGTPRRYVLVHLLNRQWMGAESGVKSSREASDAVPVFKFNVAEEIPTENYNYRYLTTVFLARPTLAPFKMVTSSQEWCGTTFKHLRWADDQLVVRSFSYFGSEGDKRWDLRTVAAPFEALPVLARACVAAGQSRVFSVLPPMRSTHAVEPEPRVAAFVLASAESTRRVPAGKFKVRRVTAGKGVDAWFDVETVAPYRLIAFSAGGVEGELRFVERRAYWDRSQGSGFHQPGAAP